MTVDATPVIVGQPAPRLRRNWAQRGIIFMNLVLIAAALSAALLLNYGYGRAAAINRVALGRSLTPVPANLEPGERVMNILLVGSDSSANLDEDDPIQIGRQGERFGDVIIVAHIDERSSEIALLSFPRDLWVEMAGTGRSSRINRAFESGGPAMLIETIENEFEIPIHHYVNVDFAGFQGLVSAVGSVEMYFETPARDWNVNAKPVPRSQTGFIVEAAGCQSLDPEMALAYVRSRYYQTQNAAGRWVTDPTSDLGRIRRQQDFLKRVLKEAIQMGARNPFVLRDLVDAGLENVAIDHELTPQLLVDIGMTYRSFDPDRLQTYSFPAVDGWVGQNQVLLPLTDSAEPVLELFRGSGFADPETVGLTVRTDDSNSATTQRLAVLERAGFEFVRSKRDVFGPGLVIQHGPDGRHAAEMVAAVFAAEASAAPLAEVRFEQVEGLAGRSLVLSLGPDPVVEEADTAPLGPAGENVSGPAETAGEVFNGTETDQTNDTSVPTREESVPEIDPIDGSPTDSGEFPSESSSATCS
ncbi:MAG: LCP family protein [Acidimicrobiales bacterium]